MADRFPRQGPPAEGDPPMRSPWYRIVGPAVLCLALAPAGAGAGAPKKGAVLDAAALAARIDAHVAAKWKEAQVVPAARADDAEFLRRLSLDLIGRIPTVSEVHDFLADPAPDK